MLQRITLLTIALGISLTLSGCIKPYQPPIEQGNRITTPDANKVHAGMTPNQVTAALGQPVMSNIYGNSLIYVYTYLPGRDKPTEKKKLVVTFRNNRVIGIDKAV